MTSYFKIIFRAGKFQKNGIIKKDFQQQSTGWWFEFFVGDFKELLIKSQNGHKVENTVKTLEV